MADNMQKKALSQAGMEGPSGSQVSAEEAVKRNSEQEVMKNSILSQMLDQDARARLNNLATVKPEKAKAVENMIIQMARIGQIRGKLSDERFRQLLDQIAEKTAKTTTVKFDRRRTAIDSDSD